MPYIGTSPSNGVRRVHTYTATASQTTFTGAGAEGATLSYKDSNFVDVFQNGVKLGDADYTATSGTSIVLGTGATVNDLVVIVVFDVFSAADTVSKADGGTFDGAVTFANGVEGGVVFNETSADVDFRVESNGDANMLFVDGGNDRLLVRKSDPSNADQAFHLGAGGDDHKMILQGNSVQRIGLQNGTSSRVFLGAAADNHFRLSKQDASVLLDVNSSGNIILGQSNAGIHLGVTSATAANLLDDYEEGNWTPSVGGNTTYDNQIGRYVKIGNKVTLWFYIQINQRNSPSVPYIAGSSPFTNSSSITGSGLVHYFEGINNNAVVLTARIDPGGSNINISGSTGSAATVANVNHDWVKNGGDIYGFVTHYTG